MATRKTKRAPARKKKAARKKSRAFTLLPSVNLTSFIFYLLLAVFFVVSMVAVSYVVFFRVVVADGSPATAAHPARVVRTACQPSAAPWPAGAGTGIERPDDTIRVAR